ncbi:hypothetical protein VTK26DRAFT_2005 [Humicola hyalothermophila]
MASLMNKARKPKFDVHLKISDLSNVPLVSGVSLIKWHLPHSIHGEHRGRTQKCPILNHRVEYNYSKIIPVRISIDRSNCLSECAIEFEVLQEFSAGGVTGATGREEKVTLGTVRLNLSEYVEESEAILRDDATAAAIKETLMSSGRTEKAHHRRRSSLSNTVPVGGDKSPRSSRDEEREPVTDVLDGVVRRYLMQDSKINSTLKISILMVQVDGERNYVAPPPKTAPVFGGIAGFIGGDAFEPVDAGATTPGHVPSSFTGKSRDVFELQDMYRRALAASWASQPGELPADQCIEDIFAGGDGFGTSPKADHRRGHSLHHAAAASAAAAVDPDPGPGPGNHGKRLGSPIAARSSHNNLRRDDSGSVSDDGEEEDDDMMGGTLRPRDLARLRRHLSRHSLASDRTVLAGGDNNRDRDRPPVAPAEPFPPLLLPSTSLHRREDSKITHDGGGLRSRSGSLASLATTLGSYDHIHRDGGGGMAGGRGRDGFKRAREVDELEVREDLIAWTVSGRSAAGGGGGGGGGGAHGGRGEGVVAVSGGVGVM